MVITNLEHLSGISPENDEKECDREKSRQVKGSFRFNGKNIVTTKVEAQSIAKGDLVGWALLNVFTITIVL